MELRVLKYFLTVAKEGSITRAANSLHLTQPTLTRQLQNLERELNHKLLIRGKYKVMLTKEGMILKKRAEDIVEMVQKTESEFQTISGAICGDVYIGGGESDSMKYVTAVIKEIQSKFPDIKFHIYSGNAEDVMEKLDKGLLDFGLLIHPVDFSKYNNITLPKKDLWGILICKDHPLAQKTFVTLEDLEHFPLIVSRQMLPKYSKESGFLNWFGDKYNSLNIVATYNLVYNAGIMVKTGVGVAITLDKLADTSSNLCFRPLYPKLESGVDFVWKKEQLFSPAAKLFLDKFKSNF